MNENTVIKNARKKLSKKKKTRELTEKEVLETKVSTISPISRGIVLATGVILFFTGIYMTIFMITLIGTFIVLVGIFGFMETIEMIADGLGTTFLRAILYADD